MLYMAHSGDTEKKGECPQRMGDTRLLWIKVKVPASTLPLFIRPRWVCPTSFHPVPLGFPNSVF